VVVAVLEDQAVVEAVPADRVEEVEDLEDPAVQEVLVVVLVDPADPAVLADQVVVVDLPAETLLPETPAEEEEVTMIRTRVSLRSQRALLHPHLRHLQAHHRAHRRPRPLRGPLRRQQRRSHLQLLRL
jgi:hypothetical protein